MLSPAPLCCLLLLSVLCADLTWGGSSFLSPEHQKVQQRKESKKPAAKPQPRALEGWLRPGAGSRAGGADDELEVRSVRGVRFCGGGGGSLGATPRPRAAPLLHQKRGQEP
ncbi:PREDICTED: appetite-regulating hormone [Condylura cristata]|uniref:appetite-regulating hormone n=1 Tax=Condylura cristata TaxID=143302 RepID=UPI0003347245|nr:PREDICTED: appetite-regulating hormone [Condylura cristata]